jgi:hypothetical protein
MKSQLLADIVVMIYRRIEEMASIFNKADIHFNMFGLKFFGSEQWNNTKKKFSPIFKGRVRKVFIPTISFRQPVIKRMN